MNNQTSRDGTCARFTQSMLMAALLLFASGCASVATQGEGEGEPEPVIISADNRMAMARKAYASGDYETALDQYKLIVQADNLHKKANYNLSIIHLELALRGMEFLGQFITDPNDARSARESFDSVVKHAEQFIEIASQHLAN